MKVLVVGGTGHVGKFMVPMLVDAGMEVTVIGSGRTPFPNNKTRSDVKYQICDVSKIDELKNISKVSPDVVIDMTGNIWNIYNTLKHVSKHFIACGSLWMYGEPRVVPTPECTQRECVFEDYKRRYAEILKLIEVSQKDGVVFTAIMPPNICGPGKIPLDCLGGRNLDLHKAHKRGMEVVLPDGPDVLLGPCDAEDIADCFVRAACSRDDARGQIFNVGSAYAITMTEFVAAYSEIHNIQIPVKRVPWNEYITDISPSIGHWWHFKSHMCPDISKSQRLLGYQPRYTPEQTLCRAVEWMLENYDI